jgi:hypothetical protein
VRLPESAGREPGQTKGARSLVDQDEAEPAHILTKGVAYIRGWASAARAVTALKEQLHACGLADALPYLHADVNIFGTGIVELGRITPATAHALAALLAKAHTAPTFTEEDTNHDNTA